MTHKNKIPILTLIIVLVFTGKSSAQKTDFEGEITYSLHIVSNSKDINSDQLKSFFGDTVISVIKKGNYRQKSLNAKGITDIIYLSSDNRWYYKMHGIDTLYFLDGSIEATKLISANKNNDVMSILGYKCKSFSITTSASKSTFYYADSLYINPSYFSGHLLSFYNIYAKETESIYLKATSENEYYTSAMTATKIEAKQIDDNIFALPKLPRVNK